MFIQKNELSQHRLVCFLTCYNDSPRRRDVITEIQAPDDKNMGNYEYGLEHDTIAVSPRDAE